MTTELIDMIIDAFALACGATLGVAFIAFLGFTIWNLLTLIFTFIEIMLSMIISFLYERFSKKPKDDDSW